MRLCSPFFATAAFTLALAACYPHRGQPRTFDADELFTQAEQACERGDLDAHDLLLERLTHRHPDSTAAKQARRILDGDDSDAPPCDGAHHTGTTDR